MRIQLSALSSVRMPFQTSQFRGMSTRTKLWGSFGLLLLFMLSIGVMGIFQTRHYASVVDEVAVTQMQKTSLSTEWKALTTSNSARFTAMIISNDVLVAAMFQKELQETAKRIETVMQDFGKLSLNEEEKRQVNTLFELKKKLDKAAEDISEVAKQGDTFEAISRLQSTYLPALSEYSKVLQKFNEDQQKIRDLRLEEMKRFQSFSMMLTLTVTAVGTLFGLFLAWNISRSIIISLNQALNLASQVASGDLRETPKSDRKDEFGALLRSLSSMTEALRSIVTKVRTSSDHINTASQEIASGNSDLSQRTERQAANLQMTASSVEELTATVTQSADTARQASQLAASASEVARRGGSVVSDVVNTMGEITASSKKISEIIGVIDGIAFQTNILALNAAVEAARAGDQGRGFAVVAGEVRALAQRSASAAKEIKELINASVAKIRSGSDLVQTAGETMTEIVESVQRVTDLIGDISAATTEQSSGISEVNTAISQLDQMTQQNAALVEQSSSASMSLREEAAKLSESVSVFRIDKA